MQPCTRGIKTILRGYEPPPFRKIDFYTSYASYASCASCASCVRCVCQKKKDIRRKSNGVRTPSTACGRSPSLEEGGLRRGKIESLQNVGGRAMRAPTTWREIATVRCVCNAGLHHCNGQMYLQPSVAPPSPVGARIARPFIPDVIITLRAGARRVIGSTAKPLYPIDGKAGRP